MYTPASGSSKISVFLPPGCPNSILIRSFGDGVLEGMPRKFPSCLKEFVLFKNHSVKGARDWREGLKLYWRFGSTSNLSVLFSTELLLLLDISPVVGKRKWLRVLCFVYSGTPKHGHTFWKSIHNDQWGALVCVCGWSVQILHYSRSTKLPCPNLSQLFIVTVISILGEC